jgi:hypothetical protein
MNKLTILLSLFIIFTSNLYSQERTIKGIVISENLELLPGVLIYNLDSVKIGETNMQGKFNIPVLKETNQIMFWYLGMESLTIKFTDNCKNLEIIMMYQGTYDFMSLRKSDRHRKKRFKKLPDIREKAFEKRIFKTDTLNYNQEFVYYRKK